MRYLCLEGISRRVQSHLHQSRLRLQKNFITQIPIYCIKIQLESKGSLNLMVHY
jgi:hypothetical protein